MLEKPDIPDQLILDRVIVEYALPVATITFLPLGADVNTAVYRLVTEQGNAYFLKLRKGVFDEITVTLPHFLKTEGNSKIIAPLETTSGILWGSLGEYKLILSPYIPGKDGYQGALSDQQWIEFGAALRAVHSAQIPISIRSRIPREQYSPHWREIVRSFQAQVEARSYDDPVAAKLAALMATKRVEIDHLVWRAGQLCLLLQARSLDFVLCHADIHPGNLLIAENDGGDNKGLYIVDWDNPIFASKERDLMFIGGGFGSTWSNARAETLFYQGYGCTEIDRMALAYYRYERVIEDIAAFCEQILTTTAGGEDREQGYQYFASNFLPGHEIEIAIKTHLDLSEK